MSSMLCGGMSKFCAFFVRNSNCFSTRRFISGRILQGASKVVVVVVLVEQMMREKDSSSMMVKK